MFMMSLGIIVGTWESVRENVDISFFYKKVFTKIKPAVNEKPRLLYDAGYTLHM